MRYFTCDENTILFANGKEKNTFTEEELKKAFAKSLKEIREHCQLTMVELSNEVEIAQPTISHYESCLRSPTILQAVKLTAYFGLTIEDFIVCGLDNAPYDIVDVYETKNK